MNDVQLFTDEQKKTLSLIVSDFGGPSATPTLLYIIENILYALKPDWELESVSDDPELKADIEVCTAALTYLKIQNIVDDR